MKTIRNLIYLLLIPALFHTAAQAAEPGIPMLTLGHVGHDHQIALYVAADQGRALEGPYGVYLNPLKDREVYELVDGGKVVARVQMIKVEGGSGMPAAMERGDIEMGLGGLGPVAKFVDKGAPLKILAPLNNDGDSLILRNDFPADSWDSFMAAVRKSEKPVRIGYKAPMAVAYMILTKALAEENITFGNDPAGKDGKPVQVITVNLQGAENIGASVESGIVDAVVLNEPEGTLIVHKGLAKRAADLSSLPPRGKWEGHPCCVVAATEKALKEKPDAVRSLLRAIIAGADVMAMNPQAALAAESRWTKTPPEVGRKSIASVNYVIRPDTQWQKAVDTWLDLMLSMNRFDKNFKDRKASEIRGKLLDLGPANDALSGMKLNSGK